MAIRVGISGWTYPPWRGVFYPAGLRRKDELRYAASQFRTIEINGTFYSLQRPAYFAEWAEETPDDFVFAVKGPRYITHIRRLRDPDVLLANFLASGIFRLGRKLGPILWQLPPNFRFDAERLAPFLAALPHDTDAAAAIARRHDDRLKGWADTRPMHHGALRHALEIRHDSFRTDAFVDLLRRHDVALVCADTVEWPRLADVTADFVYARLHGSEVLYASGYDDAAIADWARRIGTWSAGGTPADVETLARPAARQRRDVFVYFDNDVKVRAPRDAHALAAMLGTGC